MKGKKIVSKQKVAKKKQIVKKSKVVKKAVKKPALKKVIKKAKVVSKKVAPKKAIKKTTPRKLAKKVKKVAGEYSNQDLVKALKLLGIKAAELSRRLEVLPSAMSCWLNDKKLVPLEFALDIEVMTAGKVKAKSLNPDAYAKYAKILRAQAKARIKTVLETMHDPVEEVSVTDEDTTIYKPKEQMMNESNEVNVEEVLNEVEVNQDVNPESTDEQVDTLEEVEVPEELAEVVEAEEVNG